MKKEHKRDSVAVWEKEREREYEKMCATEKDSLHHVGRIF